MSPMAAPVGSFRDLVSQQVTEMDSLAGHRGRLQVLVENERGEDTLFSPRSMAPPATGPAIAHPGKFKWSVSVRLAKGLDRSDGDGIDLDVIFTQRTRFSRSLP